MRHNPMARAYVPEQRSLLGSCYAWTFQDGSDVTLMLLWMAFILQLIWRLFDEANQMRIYRLAGGSGYVRWGGIWGVLGLRARERRALREGWDGQCSAVQCRRVQPKALRPYSGNPYISRRVFIGERASTVGDPVGALMQRAGARVQVIDPLILHQPASVQLDAAIIPTCCSAHDVGTSSTCWIGLRWCWSSCGRRSCATSQCLRWAGLARTVC